MSTQPLLWPDAGPAVEWPDAIYQQAGVGSRVWTRHRAALDGTRCGRNNGLPLLGSPTTPDERLLCWTCAYCWPKGAAR